MSDIPDYLIVDDYFEPNGEAVIEHHTEMFDVPDKTQPEAFWYHHRSDELDEKLVFDERCAKCRDERITGG